MKPRTRGDCLPGGVNEHRPCCYSECRYHLDHSEQSCVLDVADQGGASLEEVAEYLKLSRERVRQVEVRVLSKLGRRQVLRQFVWPK